MARVLWCETCDGATGVLLIDRLTICATCRSEVVWREMGDEPFTLTHMDRLLLKSFRIAAS